MAGALTYYKGKRGILRITVKPTALEPVVYRVQTSNLVVQEIDVPAGTDRALVLEYTNAIQAMAVAMHSNVEGVQVGFTNAVQAPTTATATVFDFILRPFAVFSELTSLVWSSYPGVVIRNGTAYDARLTIIYWSQLPG